MTTHRLGLSAGLLGLGLWLATIPAARSQQDQVPAADAAAQAQAEPQAEQGMEVLTRGPIHEAYAEPVDNHPLPSKIVLKQPPAPIEETPPDQRPAGENVQWIPGYWAWEDDRNDFVWVRGIWRMPPPGCTWVPGHWSWVVV